MGLFNRRKKKKNSTETEAFIEVLQAQQIAQSEKLYQERKREESRFDPKKVVPSSANEPLTSVEAAFLQKIAKQPVINPEVAGYWKYEYNIDFSRIMTKLIGNGYLCVKSSVEMPEFMKVPQLKDVLRKANLPVSGKKAELIDRIKEIPSENLLQYIEEPEERYWLTKKGQRTVDGVKESVTKNIELEDECLNLIANQDFNGAYFLICQPKETKQFPREIGIDWNEQTQKGLDEKTIEMYRNIQGESTGDERAFRNCLILCDLLGANNPTPLIYRLSLRLNDEEIARSHYQKGVAFSIREIAKYIEMGVSEYEILGSEEKPICKKMDGKRFPVSKAKIGENFPPFFEECTCTTCPAIDNDVWGW